MTYICSIKEYIKNVTAEIELELSPSDYLVCDDEDELREFIYEDLSEAIDYGDVNVSDFEDHIINIPEEFINEWRKLKETWN